MQLQLGRSMLQKPEIVSSKVVFRGWFKVIVDMLRVPGRKELYEYHTAKPGDGVGVLAFVDKDNLMLARQYRHSIRKYEDSILELVQGGMAKGETPIDCGRREFLEETGYTGNFEYLTGNYPLACALDMRTYAVMATDIHKIQEPIEDPLEDMEIVVMPYEQVLEEILEDKHKDAILKTAVLVYDAKFRRI